MKNFKDLDSSETEKQINFKDEALIHQQALYNYALKIVTNADDAQDLLQETYYKAYKSYNQFEKGTNSKAWMFMILKNTFINNYRKLKRTPVKVDYDEVENIFENIKTDQTHNNQLDMEFYNNLLSDELSVALAKLPAKMRDVFLMYDLNGFTYEEIAETVIIPIGTVRSRIYRARRFLYKELSGYAKLNGYLN